MLQDVTIWMQINKRKSYAPKNRKNQGRPQKRLVDVVRSELVNRSPNYNDDECSGRNAVTP